MVMEVLQEDMGDGTMQCTDHPYKNNAPGGICAFCLQEKLGKLVSSSFPIAVFPSSSSSSSPSFRSELGGSAAVPVRHNAATAPGSQLVNHGGNSSDCNYHHFYSRRSSRIPFLLIQRKKKKKDAVVTGSDQAGIVFKRSKSTATPRPGMNFMGSDYSDDYSPQKRGFWSFFYLSRHQSTAGKSVRSLKDAGFRSSAALSSTGTAPVTSNVGSLSQQGRREKKEEFVVVDENGSPDGGASFDRKVSRSRSVGCGSRSFSGDFFERISTGFGDCTLRRVESQREGKPKVPAAIRNGGSGGTGQDCIKERVKCGGIFSGFMITSSSSSSSSSSYLVSSSTEDNLNRSKPTASSAAGSHLVHGRSKSWGWAFASPIRVFRPYSGKRDAANKNPTTPNLAAIPSLLAVRG